MTRCEAKRHARGRAAVPSILGAGALPDLDSRSACVPAQHAPLCQGTQRTHVPWPAGCRAEAQCVSLLHGACDPEAFGGRPCSSMLCYSGANRSAKPDLYAHPPTGYCQLLEDLALYVFQSVDGRLLRNHVLHARLLRLRARPHTRVSTAHSHRTLGMPQATKRMRTSAQQRHSANSPIAKNGLSTSDAGRDGCQRIAGARCRRRRGRTGSAMSTRVQLYSSRS